MASTIAYGLYALRDPGGAFETAAPAAYVSLMVTLLVVVIVQRRQDRRH